MLGKKWFGFRCEKKYWMLNKTIKLLIYKDLWKKKYVALKNIGKIISLKMGEWFFFI